MIYEVQMTNQHQARHFKVKDLMIIKQCNPSIAKKQELLPQEFLGAMTWLLYMIVISTITHTNTICNLPWQLT